MYNKVDAKLDFVGNENEVSAFWKEHDVFNKSLDKNKGDKIFSFYEGPPTANGMPHIGHPLTRAMKDVIPRYKTMKGYYVPRKAGWDTHGLPVEVQVEKKMGIEHKSDIEKFGVDKFIKECRESVWKYKGLWEDFSEKLGYWIDTEHAYITYDNNYIESVFWALKEMDKKGLIYKGHKIVPYCPRCGTALSKAEVEQNDCYKVLNEKSVFVKFKSLEEDNTYFIVWTTTPWTLPSNVAICMNPEEVYAKVSSAGANYIMLKELIPTLFEEGSYEIVYEKQGKEFEHQKYEPLFDFVSKDLNNAYFVTVDNYVTTTDGTGIVHIAPAFGEDDANVGKKYNLDFVQLVDDEGKLSKETGEFAGIFVKDADKLIIKSLTAEDKMFKVMPFEHSYPHCWRCNTPLLYYASNAWFIKMTSLRDELTKNNESVTWIPDNIKHGRMGNFLSNNVDWGISRTRYWGTPLPFWVCESGHIHVIGSVKELQSLSGCSADIDLHKPTLDKITFPCPECGKTMHRTTEVMDCWFDSGSMPFAQYHYPFENKELFESTYPADFICEGIDQTRGWFNSLQNINTVLFGKSPYKSCVALGLINDKYGKKMSKSKGNGVDPMYILNKEGADALRWYFYNNAIPGISLNFNEDSLQELQRKFMGTLWNTYAFYILYADIDQFDATKYDIKKCKLAFIDKWLLSKYNALVKSVTEKLDRFDTLNSSREITDFVDELSNWYVRRSRERYWVSGQTDDKISAFMTLYIVLSGLTKLLAPFIPFMTEKIYQNLVRSIDHSAPLSVHLCDYPVADESMINISLNDGMEKVLDIVALGRLARNNTNIKNRQPLSRAIVCSASALELSSELIGLIKGELNVENVEVLHDAYEYVQYSLKPQLKVLGPKYGKLIGNIREALTKLDANAVVKKVRNGESVTISVADQDITLTENDLFVEVNNKEGYVSESNGVITIILDTEITDELYKKGVMRETISKIQNLRKDSGFEVVDHIVISFSGDSELLDAIKTNSDEIAKNTLCDEYRDQVKGFTTSLELDDKKIDITIAKV